MDRLLIRKAVLADAEPIARLHVASWRAAYGDFMPPKQMAWISEVRETRRANDLIRNPETPYLVAEDDDAIVGFLVYGPPGDDCDPRSTRQIYTFFVDPQRYRRGIGTQLLTAMEAEISVPEITVWVMTQGVHGPRFFARSGFEREHQTEKMFRLIDTDFPIVRYRKQR
jgi:N-acetylglutamate synthase-like GNAT family acetyltransferase